MGQGVREGESRSESVGPFPQRRDIHAVGALSTTCSAAETFARHRHNNCATETFSGRLMSLEHLRCNPDGRTYDAQRWLGSYSYTLG